MERRYCFKGVPIKWDKTGIYCCESSEQGFSDPHPSGRHALHGRGNANLRSIVAETGEAKTLLRTYLWLQMEPLESVWSLHNMVVTLLGKGELNFLFLFSNEVSVKFVPVKW